MSENTLTVEFKLFGKHLNLEKVNQRLGIECTESQLSDGKTNSFWIISRSARGQINISEICNQIVDELIPKQEAILELIRQYDLRASLDLELYQRPRTDHEVMYGEYFVTGSYFETRVLKFLGAIGATLHVEADCECIG